MDQNSEQPDKRILDRIDGFKRGIDPEEARRKREDEAFSLRKAQRDEQLNKRRQRIDGALAPADSAAPLTEAGDANDPPSVVEPGRIERLVQMLQVEDVNTQLEAVMAFRKLLSIERNPPIQQVIDTGIIPRLVHFLTFHNHPQLQFEAAWALTNIASGTSRHTKAVMDHGAVEIFVQLLRSRNTDVAEQAVWALGNIAGDSPQCRDHVLRAGALQPLLAHCQPAAKLSMLRNATWTLSNLCRGKPQPEFHAVSAALPVLAGLVHSRDDEVLTDACWALSYLSDDTGPNNNKIQAVISSGVARRLVELLLHQNANVRTPALRTVGNIVTGDDLQTQVIISCNALPCLQALLGHQKKSIRKEACWTISNITAGNREQIQAVIDANIIPVIVDQMKFAEFDIKREACWAISNATSGGSEAQVKFLVEQSVIPPLCEMFKCQDPKIIMVALEGIDNILKVGQKEANAMGASNRYVAFVEACHGLETLEELQANLNQEIAQKALKILRDYWEEDEAPPQQSMTTPNNFPGFPPQGTNPGGYQF